MTDSLSMEMFLDPCTIKAIALEDLQNRLFDGEPIVDANNVATWMLENTSTTIAGAMLAVKNQMDVFYKLRANDIEDLYRHMSDYDSIGVHATPAPFEVVMEIEKSSISYEAKMYDEVYRQVIIPVDTEFKFGEYTFGIYYPIVIRINSKTLSTTVYWDDSISNPLHTLINNSIDFMEVTEDSIEYIQIRIPTYQFVRQTVEESITKDMGFVKTYPYTDNFYAVRVFNYINNNWEPISVVLSETNYDISSPTVRFVVDQGSNSVKVIIPPVYILTGLIKSKVKIDIYTTKGELDIDISSVEADSVTKNFHAKTSDTYSTILDRSAAIALYPAISMIQGGTNGITNVELKKRIVNNSFYKDVIKSTSDIEAYFSNLGFSSSRYACNVTDMIYLCHNQMTNSKGGVIAAGNVRTMFTESIISNCNSIMENTDGSVTILPSTIYSYSSDSGICTPLTTAEATALSIKNKENKIADYNSHIYTKSPFHIRLDRSTRYPIAYTYDLNQPTTKYLKTIAENTNAEVILKVYAVQVVHDGISGFDIKFLIGKSEGYTYNDIILFFYTYSANGSKVWTTASYVTEFDGRWVFNAHIDTNYSLFKDNTIFLSSLRNDSGALGFEVPLNFDANMILLIKSSILSEDALNPNVGVNVFADYKNIHTPVIEQRVNITLGQYLSGIYNNVDVIYKENVYLTYTENVPARATSDIYEYDTNGIIVFTIVNGSPVYNKVYSVGDILLDGEGDPIIKHHIGDYVLDANGQPIVANEFERNLDYVVDMIHIDAKLDVMTDTSYTNIMEYNRKKMLSYMNTIDEATNHLIEGTKLYYTPIRTIGSTTSTVGNNLTLTHSLELTVRFKLFVYDFVLKDDTIKETIYNNIVSIIDNYTNDSTNNVVASDVITDLIKNNMSEYIINVNVYGFFDDMNIQTLICSSSNVKPHLKQYLVLEDDGTITVARGLTLEYVSI